MYSIWLRRGFPPRLNLEITNSRADETGVDERQRIACLRMSARRRFRSYVRTKLTMRIDRTMGSDPSANLRCLRCGSSRFLREIHQLSRNLLSAILQAITLSQIRIEVLGSRRKMVGYCALRDLNLWNGCISPHNQRSKSPRTRTTVI